MKNFRLFLFTASLMLAGCSTMMNNNFAPVTNGWQDTEAASRDYRVQPEDTLYSIAFRYGLDYRKLAEANHIASPYHIATGEKLVLLPGANDALAGDANTVDSHMAGSVKTAGAPSSTVISEPAAANKAPAQVVASPAASNVPADVPVNTNSKWQWPVRGKIIQNFSDNYGGNKGIDIAGKIGDPVRATAGGRVVYCGSSLRGYGLLIIIKHNAEFLSAYAHNSKALVKDGQTVKAGQTIALMGDSDAAHPMLHFEIRRAGKPVDPLGYLTGKN